MANEGGMHRRQKDTEACSGKANEGGMHGEAMETLVTLRQPDIKSAIGLALYVL